MPVPAADEGGKSALAAATGTPPVFLIDPSPEIWTLNKGQNATFTIMVQDADNDPLHVVWDWGDGTNSTNDTGPAAGGVILRQRHAWSPNIPGVGDVFPVRYINFTLNITLDDHNGNIVYDLTTVRIAMPPNGYPLCRVAIPYPRVDPSDVVTIVANATDPEGEALTWTFYFNDGVANYRTVVSTTPVSAPNQTVWNNITHTFGAAGRHRVTLYVSDAPIPYQTGNHNTSWFAEVDVVPNYIPQVLAVINVAPNDPVINASLGYVLVDYSIQASDPDGDILTVTWDFDDGTAPVVNVSSGGTATHTFDQVKNYTDAGEFNVSVVVTDGWPGHDILVYRIVSVNSTNKPPSIVRFEYDLSHGLYALPNETVNFTLIIKDPEEDVVEVAVNFGDGSPIERFNLTDYVDGNATVVFYHSYAQKGNYTIFINYTDHKRGLFNHSKSTNASIRIDTEPIIIVKRWSWWDYTSLGLFFMIPVLIALRFVIIAKRRKSVEEEGYSLEEWKLIRSQEKRSEKDET